MNVMGNVTNIASQLGSNKSFEEAKQIEITQNVIKFGSSVYQFRNVTGFKVSKIEKSVQSLVFGIVLTLIGFSLVNLSPPIGITAIGIGIFLIYQYAIQKNDYIFSIFLNSGRESVFISKDRAFLMEIVSLVYKIMLEGSESKYLVNIQDRSINVSGSVNNSKFVSGDSQSSFND
jgi:hypothetical protein